MNKKLMIKYITLLGAFTIALNVSSYTTSANKVAADNESSLEEQQNAFADLSTQASLSFCYNEDKYPFVQVTSKSEINPYDSYVMLAENTKKVYCPDPGNIDIIPYIGSNHLPGIPCREHDGPTSKYNNCYEEDIFEILFKFRETMDDDVWEVKSTTGKFLSIIDSNPDKGENVGDLRILETFDNCNPYFKFDFDADGNFILRPDLTDKDDSYVNKNKVVRFSSYHFEGEQNKLYYSMNAFDDDENILEDTSPIKLYRKIEVQEDWDKEQYQRIDKEEKFDINDTFVLKYNAEFEIVENQTTEILDAVCGIDGNSNFTHVQATINSTKEFIQNDSSYSAFTLEQVDDTSEYYIKVGNSKYLGSQGIPLRYPTRDVCLCEKEENPLKFTIQYVDGYFTFSTKAIIDGKSEDAYLIPIQRAVYYESAENYKFPLALMAKFAIEQLTEYLLPRFKLYKFVNIDDVLVHKISLFSDYEAANADKYALSLKIQLYVPTEYYKRFKIWSEVLKYYMYYSFNGGTPVRTELTHPVVEEDENQNKSLRLSMVFKSIPLTDLDVRFNVWAAYCIGRDDLMWESSGLNNGQGYTIREMVQKYIDDYNAHPEEHKDDIKPHLRALKKLVNYNKQ